jgi:pyrroloquinoline quinone (PQQ) biosynthesis protein C
LRRNLLDHSFYRKWVAGELSVDELRYYTCQYALVVAALPQWLRQAASGLQAQAVQLERHAVEEDRHVALWHTFAKALGITASVLATTVPNPATVELLRRADELSRQPAGVAVAWAIEAQTPAVSAEKLRGLKAHYDIDSQTGGEYFDVHSSRDVVHKAELDTVIAGLSNDDFSTAQRNADVILDGLWDLLTSVERAA